MTSTPTEATRELTEEEELRIPRYFTNKYYSITYESYYATWGSLNISSNTGDFPWLISIQNRDLNDNDYEEACPGYKQIEDIDFYNLISQYHGKEVAWSSNKNGWYYRNHRKVIFQTEFGTPQGKSPSNHDSEPDEEEVSQLLDSATQTLTALLAQASGPHTPQSGAQTPGTPAQQPYPTPATGPQPPTQPAASSS